MSSMTNEDRMRHAYEDAEYERWAAIHAEQIEEDAYQAWASDRRDDGEDDSREAWVDHLDAMLPDE